MINSTFESIIPWHWTAVTLATEPLMTVWPVLRLDALKIEVVGHMVLKVAETWDIRKPKIASEAKMMAKICALWRLIQPPRALPAFSASVSFSSLDSLPLTHELLHT